LQQTLCCTGTCCLKTALYPRLIPLGILLARSCSSGSGAACQHLCCCLHLITLKHHILACASQPAAVIIVLMYTHKFSHIYPDKMPPRTHSASRTAHCVRQFQMERGLGADAPATGWARSCSHACQFVGGALIMSPDYHLHSRQLSPGCGLLVHEDP